MKIAICAKGSDLDAELDDHLGQCPYFVIVDTSSQAFEAIPNPGTKASAGLGQAAAQAVINSGAQAVIGPHFGPSPYAMLTGVGVEAFSGQGGTVREALAAYQENRLKRAEEGDPGHAHERKHQHQHGQGPGRGQHACQARGQGRRAGSIEARG